MTTQKRTTSDRSGSSSHVASVHYSRKSDEWKTPPDFFAEVSAEFGPFDLDAAASAENTLCERYFTAEQNALQQEWGTGTCYCNPPYSKLYQFVAKAYAESRKGATCILLIPARTDTRAFHEFIFGKAEVRFLKGRLRFSNAPYPAPFPSCLVIYRPPAGAAGDNA